MQKQPPNQQEIASGPHTWTPDKGYRPAQPSKRDYPKWVNGVLCADAAAEVKAKAKAQQAPSK